MSSATMAEQMDRNLFGVFGERNPAQRAALSQLTYTEDVVFSDPEQSTTGRAQLEQRAQALLDKFPGFVFIHDGPLYASEDMAVLAWAFGPPGAPVARGVDVAFFRAGKICRLHTIFKT